MSIKIKSFINEIEQPPSGTDKNDAYVRNQCVKYFLRHIRRYSILGRDELQYVTWLLGSRKSELGHHVLRYLPDQKREQLWESLIAAGNDTDDYANELLYVINKMPASDQCKITQFNRQILISKLKQLTYRGKSEIEKNSKFTQKMFGLDNHEIELVIFLFITATYDAPEGLFERTLQCDRFAGRKHLSNILGLSMAQIARTISRLEQLGIVDNSPRGFSLEDDILSLLQDQDSDQISKRYFQRVYPKTTPLNFHFFDPEVTSYLQKLVSQKTETPTHLLFYGPPGTGKTTMANTLAVTAKAPIYAITRAEDNRSEKRRNAIIACMNMTNFKDGSIIIVDEADNLINTTNSWKFRGEIQDKGWLNHLMEKPGTRVIWITNTTSGIEDSVLRRFAYTLKFKAFSSKQRVVLFERIIRSNRVKRFFSHADLQAFAKSYRVTAGPIDLAVKKAKETGAATRSDFQRAVRISLDAYLSFRKGKQRASQRPTEDTTYTLKGLNLSDNVHDIIEQLGRFNMLLYSGDQTSADGIAMLFHGPPGAGKTALANCLGEKLSRKVMVRRYSDLQSMWLGQGEKNIRDAFLEAVEEEAILIVDEADSMLWSRDRAQRSWEISFTNEFLTQMESFRGLLICTTNRLRDLDSAAIRRFTYKIEFDYLTPEGNLIFYRKLLMPLVESQICDVHCGQIKRIRFLAPGDFQTVRKRFALFPEQDVSHEKIIEQLEAEAKVKKVHTGRRAIGF